MNGAQCNGPRCGRFAEHPNPGWLFLAQNPTEAAWSLIPGLPGAGPQLTGTFCSYPCVADFAYTRAVITGPATGTEPAGTGWPGTSSNEETLGGGHG